MLIGANKPNLCLSKRRTSGTVRDARVKRRATRPHQCGHQFDVKLMRVVVDDGYALCQARVTISREQHSLRPGEEWRASQQIAPLCVSAGSMASTLDRDCNISDWEARGRIGNHTL